MPLDTKTVLGWAPLQPAIPGEATALPDPSSSQPVPAAQAVTPLPMPPRRTIQPRRGRPQPRPVVHHPLPGYRASPVTEPPLPPVLLPPVLPEAQPEEAKPERTTGAGSETAALTLLDLPIIHDDDDDGAVVEADAPADHERPLQLPSLHLLCAILLHVAGVLADNDPEVYIEAEIAQYTGLALMLWSAILIVRRAGRPPMDGA